MGRGMPVRRAVKANSRRAITIAACARVPLVRVRRLNRLRLAGTTRGPAVAGPPLSVPPPSCLLAQVDEAVDVDAEAGRRGLLGTERLHGDPVLDAGGGVVVDPHDLRGLDGRRVQVDR